MTHNSLAATIEVQRDLLEFLLTAGHLLQRAEPVLVAAAVVEAHAPGHAGPGASSPVGGEVGWGGRQDVRAKVAHTVGLTCHGDRGEHRVPANRSLPVLPARLAAGVDHRGGARGPPRVILTAGA